MLITTTPFILIAVSLFVGPIVVMVAEYFINK